MKLGILIKVVVAIAGIGIMIYLAVTVIPRSMITLTKAAPEKKVSATKSTVIGTKVLAKADSVEACKVKVFLAGESGIEVSGKVAELNAVEGGKDLEISSVEQVTDSVGSMTFEIRTGKEGLYRLQASVDGVVIGREVKVTFRN